MQDQVYITGHRSPDTDSICSAIAYAGLKNRLGRAHAIPARLGDLNRESRFVLDYFNMEAPVYLESIQPLVEDVDFDPSFGISPNTTLYRANDIMQEYLLNSLAVVDSDQEMVGIISMSNLSKTYADVWDDNILNRADTPLSNFVDVLSAEVLYMPDEPRKSTGSIEIYAMDKLDPQLIHENDITLLGDRYDAQKDVLENKVAIMILTNGTKLSKELRPLAEKNRVTVLSTHLTTFMAARLLPQAVPVSFAMTKDNLVAFHLRDSLDEVKETMAATRYRSFPVLDSNDHVVGSINRYHLINTGKKKVILVDHNEATQSVPDLDRAEILEIIDHHRVANINTDSPIYYRAEPVGCTCTIIAQMYFERGIMPSRVQAGLMMSAIISDTLLFRSPTTTDMDRLMVQRLSTICGLDPEEYGMEMLTAGTSLKGKNASDILTEDAKEFDIQGQLFKVAQVMTMDMTSVKEIKQELLDQMNVLMKNQGYETYVLVVTDIFKEDSVIILDGDYCEEIAKEFGESLEDHAFLAKGVLSRKKQVIPVLTQAVSKAKETRI